MRVKIYTRTGDEGKTSLYGGKRVSKFNPQVVSYGIIDELNSALGIVIASIETERKLKDFLTDVQSDLFTIGAYLSGANNSLDKLAERVNKMENLIDSLDKELEELKNFILPGGSKNASFTHLARSICRRAEREIVSLAKKKGRGVDRSVLVYLNRLSDLLFEIARYLNKKEKIADIIWR